ncbi:unnamed protein product [Closterium sp. Yama58-4]|nr:unnamed protein product [Closterium sp. Yama58-4]
MPELEPIFEGVFENSPNHPAGFEPAAPPPGAASANASPKESPKNSPKTSPQKSRSPSKTASPRRAQSPQKAQSPSPVAAKVIPVTDATAATEAHFEASQKSTPVAVKVIPVTDSRAEDAIVAAPSPAAPTAAAAAPAPAAAEQPSPVPQTTTAAKDSEDSTSAVNSTSSGMTDEQAAVVIQSVWRGHQVRSSKPFEVAKPIVELRKLLREMEERLGDKEFVAKVVTEPMEKLRATETIMCWLFRLDGVQSMNQEVRALRRDMARKLNRLLDRFDALTLPAPEE